LPDDDDDAFISLFSPPPRAASISRASASRSAAIAFIFASALSTASLFASSSASAFSCVVCRFSALLCARPPYSIASFSLASARSASTRSDAALRASPAMSASCALTVGFDSSIDFIASTSTPRSSASTTSSASDDDDDARTRITPRDGPGIDAGRRDATRDDAATRARAGAWTREGGGAAREGGAETVVATCIVWAGRRRAASARRGQSSTREAVPGFTRAAVIVSNPVGRAIKRSSSPIRQARVHRFELGRACEMIGAFTQKTVWNVLVRATFVWKSVTK
jgi:hypothetical protein